MTRLNDQSTVLQLKNFKDHVDGKEGLILLATFQSIAEDGIAATSTHAIASRAGLNQGNIHYYFKSKNDLLTHVLEILFKNFTENLQAILSSNKGLFDKLDLIIDSGYSLLGSGRDEFIVAIAYWAHSMSVGGRILNLYRKLFRNFRASLVRTLKEGERDGLVKKGMSEEVALLLIGAIDGLGLQYVMDPKNFDPERSVTLLKQLLKEALKT